MINVNFIEYMQGSDFIEHMRRSQLFIIITLIQVDRQSQSAILWIIIYFPGRSAERIWDSVDGYSLWIGFLKDKIFKQNWMTN